MGMFPYYIALLLVLICAYQYKSYLPEKKKRNILIVSLMPVFCLLAFKSENVGVDTMNYIRMFNTSGEFQAVDNESRIELGYQYLTILLNRISDSNQSLFIASAFIICISLFSFLKRTATNPPLALFFFLTMGFFQFSLTGIRQAISIAITLNAMAFIEQKKVLKFLVIILLAALFHKSALFCLPLYWVMNLDVNKRNVIYVTIGMCIVYFLAEPLLLVAADMLNYDYGVESTDNGFIFMSVVLLITVLCYLQRKKLQECKISNKYLINANYLSLMLWVIRLISRTAERVALFFMPYTYVALEEYLVSRPARDRNTYIIIALIVATYLFIHRMSPNEHLNNYTFFWQ